MQQRLTILTYALERWQTLAAVIVAAAGIAATIVFFEGSVPVILAWIAFAVLSVGAMVAVSFRDAESVDEALMARVDLGELRSRVLRDKVRRALEYQTAIRRAIRETTADELRSSLETITRQMNEPLELIFNLARRYEDYQADTLLNEDRQRLAREMAARGGKGLAPAEQEQLATLQKLAQLMQDTAQAIDSSVAQLGNSYSQVQLIRSTGELRGGQVERVLDDLKESSSQLQDISSALDEVYGR